MIENQKKDLLCTTITMTITVGRLNAPMWIMRGSFSTSREPFSAGSEASEASIDACCDSLSDIVRPIY